MSTEQQPRNNEPERVREREVIVTNDGGGRSSMGGVVVAILAVVAIVVLVFVMFGQMGGEDGDPGLPDVNVNLPEGDNGGGGDDGGDTGGDTGGDE